MSEIVYILTNDAMQGFVKIGMTTSSIEDRMRSLDTTGVPLPFTCFHAAEVSNAQRVERLLHDAFKDNRVRQRREFFQIDPERVLSALQLAELKDVTPRDDVETEEGDIEALSKVRKRRGRFIMSHFGIPVDAKLTFAKDETITATVLEGNMVEYQGEAMTLSGSALKAIHSLGYTWKAVAGPDFWQYQGETLANIRSEYENKSGDTDEATFDSKYRIVRDEAGSINIWKIDDQPERLVEPAKPILREIAHKIGVELVGSTGNDKNTRQLGAHIIDQLNIKPTSQE